MGAKSLLKIEPKLVKIIDERLKNNGLAQQAIKDKNARLVMVKAAEALVGTKEKTGKNDGEIIELIQETYGGHSGEAYCIAGIMTCAAYAALKTGLEHKLFETESSRALWENTPITQRVKKIPLPGAAMVWTDVKNGKLQWTGHGEIVIYADENEIHCVGFNTSGTTKPGSTVNREGNGVYYTVRSYKNTSARVLRGFLKPF